METKLFCGTFGNISQRAAFTYLRSLAKLTHVRPGGLTPAQQAEMEDSQRDLHAFFQAFYETLYQHPERFGLPLTEDGFVDEEHRDESLSKEEINRRLKKPKELIALGLDFLMAAGQDGKLAGQDLVIDLQKIPDWKKTVRTLRKFISGLAGVGLDLRESKDQVVLSSERFPWMMPALQTLAAACAQAEDAKMGRFHFARCDFKALHENYTLDALELYRIFNPVDFARITQLHDYFTGMNYKPTCLIGGISAWVVKYQGKRQVKASPLFQVEFQERQKNPLLVLIKCASSNRIVPLMAEQSKALQDDFFARTYRCRGAECGWCKNRKTLGPVVYEHDGERTAICWYTRPNVFNFNDDSVELIKEYALLHERLNE